MKTIEASVTAQNLVIEPSVLSVAESVNQYALKITYDAEWDDVDTKIVTFKGANGKAYAIQDTGEEGGVTIPWEVLRCPGKVTVGVVGYVGTITKIITTGIYDRNTFVVMPAAFGLTEALTPTPDIYQQIVTRLAELQTQIGNLSNLDTTAKNNLVAAINEVLTTAGVTRISDDSGAEATGDVSIKTINGQSIIGEGNIEIEGGDGQVKSVNNVEPDENGNVELTAATIGAQATLDQAQLTAVNSGIDSTKVAQIATNTAAITGKQDALNAAQLTAVNSGIDSTKVAQIATNVTDIDGIEAKIPAQATSSNQLADKNFVNSSVATNTANYISNNGEPFASLADLQSYSGTLTNNDYAFVVGTDAAGNTTYTRYKYNASTTTWAEEYVLNNSSFTSTQWSAINSGISSSDVTKLGGIEAGAEVNDIDSISLNGTALTPDANKNVEITTPTYSDFTGTDGTAAGAHGLVPAPATTDAGKYLKADGTWGRVQAGPTVVQTTGSSTTDVMSQKAVTEIIGDVESALQTINNGGN